MTVIKTYVVKYESEVAPILDLRLDTHICDRIVFLLQKAGTR